MCVCQIHERREQWQTVYCVSQMALLTRANITLVKVMHYIGKKVPFGMHPWSSVEGAGVQSALLYQPLY